MKHAESRRIRDLVREAVKNGKTLDEAAIAFGVSLSWVRNHVRGLKYSMTQIPSVDSYKILGWLIKTDDTYEEIAIRFDISKQRVGQIADRARAAGIKIHDRKKKTVLKNGSVQSCNEADQSGGAESSRGS